MKAVRIHARGGREVLTLEEVPDPEPGQGEALIKVAVAGVNVADVGQRQGNYPNLAPLPMILGYEAGGTVAEVGPGVQGLARGTRVVAHVEGGYAEFALAKAEEVIPVPPHVPLEQAVAIPIQGLTAYLLLDRAARLLAGESVLVHAAGGGVGTLALQIARLLGAGKVIATSRSAEKLDLARDLGADAAVNTTARDWPREVMDATEGRGVDVVLDAVGGPIGQASIELLAPFGRMVVFGAASGQPTMMAAQMLVRKCISVIGFNTPAQHPVDMGRAGGFIVGNMAVGRLRAVVKDSFPLAEVAEAHRVVEENRAVGKVVLTV